METTAAHGLLQQLGKNPQASRWLIQGSGIAGDSAYVPWLLKKMGDLITARLAGEAFSTIAGVDLGQAALDRPAPGELRVRAERRSRRPERRHGPGRRVAVAGRREDRRVVGSQSVRFRQGTRYFMGAPVTREHCIDVLKNGYQRQRILAAHYLCLLDPGTPLFNTSAPAWRQQRLLAKMT